jgi:hypothetical protein
MKKYFEIKIFILPLQSVRNSGLFYYADVAQLARAADL